MGRARAEALRLFEQWTASLLTSCPDADGQVKRVLRRFALCAAAGVLARDRAGVLPETLDAGMSITFLPSFLDGRARRGRSLGRRRHSGADTAFHCAARHKPFQDLNTEQAYGVIHRVGFRKKGDDGRTEYIILPESF